MRVQPEETGQEITVALNEISQLTVFINLMDTDKHRSHAIQRLRKLQIQTQRALNLLLYGKAEL